MITCLRAPYAPLPLKAPRKYHGLGVVADGKITFPWSVIPQEASSLEAGNPKATVPYLPRVPLTCDAPHPEHGGSGSDLGMRASYLHVQHMSSPTARNRVR